MSTKSEKNQFRRLVGDYEDESIEDSEIESYLDDTVRELTEDFVDANNAPAPVVDFDLLHQQYHTEIIYKAAINWWWRRLAVLADRHSKSVGQTSEQSSEKWERAMQMIEKLQAYYENIQALGTDITMGNLSRFSKITLQRHGGQREESSLENGQGF